MKKVLSTKQARKGRRGTGSRKAATSAASKGKAIVVVDKPIQLTQDVADDLFETVIRPTNNIGLITNGIDAKGLSKLLIDVDDRLTVATCEGAEYLFVHCVGELALESLEAQGMELNGNGKITLIHSLKSDFEANKHTLKRGTVVTQDVNAGQARKYHSAKTVDRFTSKV